MCIIKYSVSNICVSIVKLTSVPTGPLGPGKPLSPKSPFGPYLKEKEVLSIMLCVIIQRLYTDFYPICSASCDCLIVSCTHSYLWPWKSL